MEQEKDKGVKITTWIYLRKYQLLTTISLLAFIVWTLRPDVSLGMPESYEGCIEQLRKVPCCTNQEAKNNFGSPKWWNGDIRKEKLKNPVQTILDVGTYPGNDFKFLHELYQPTKHIGHEQIGDYAFSLRDEYKDDSTVTIRSICDAAEPRLTRTVYYADGKEDVIMTKDFETFFTVDGFSDTGLSLLHMDCDGCELEVLASIANHNLSPKIDVLQFSSHKVGDNPAELYCKSIMSLAKTHTRTVWSPWAWERWERKLQ